MIFSFYKLLPKKALSTLMYRLSRVEIRPIKNLLIYLYCFITHANTAFADRKNKYDYHSLNDFFTRELAVGIRAIDSESDSVVSPVDGCVAIYGPIKAGQLFQAKSQQYSLAALLNSQEMSEFYQQGNTITLYLSPKDYHRIHAPCDCELQAMSFCPGNKHSVGLDYLTKIPNLFVGNERLVCHFTTPFGKMALIMVGALNVSSIETVWAGEIKPQGDNHYQYNEKITFTKGQELGRFNLGSTVILCFEHAVHWDNPKINTQDGILMGEKIAQGNRGNNAKKA